MLKENLITQGVTVGKYRIEARVAEGGMGVFWRALDTKLDRTVGLKTLHTEFAIDSQLRDRFINEARALAKLNHPNICVLHDFFESGEQLYIVMEFILGETLADIVRHTGALPRAQVVPIFRQILLALEYAHNHGVIHRDIKPSNIMVTEQGIVKVMDFGIAKMVGAPIQLTRTGRKVGSVLYMSPEQIREQPVDHRSDLYSLGIALFQVCTGRVPFDATSEYDAMKAHLDETVPSPRSLNPSVSEDLEYVITRAMAKRPEDRFQSADEMRKALGSADLGAVPDLSSSGDRVVIASGEKTRVDALGDAGAPKGKTSGLKWAILVSALVVVSLLALRIAHRMKQSAIPLVSTSTALPSGGTVTAPPVVSPPITNQQSSAVPDSLALSAVPVSGGANGMTGLVTNPASGDASTAPATPAGQVAAPTSSAPLAGGVSADSLPAKPTSAALQVGGASAATSPDKPHTPAKKPTVQHQRAEAQPQMSSPPAKPVVLNKYSLTVVVKPGGLFQVDRSGWRETGGRLEEGAHRLEAMGPGFPITSDNFKLKRDTTITIDLKARSASNSDGDLRVSAKSERGDFPACKVKINGAEAGLLPGLRLPLKTGAYEIELVPPENLQVDSLQFEGTSFAGARARIKVPPTSRSFARYFLSPRK